MIERRSSFSVAIAALLALLIACDSHSAPPSEQAAVASQGSERELRVVATTTIVGDVVREVGGDVGEVAVLLPRGADPHSFEPAPRDVALVADADVIFVNGIGLEQFLEPVLVNAKEGAEVVDLSDGIELLEIGLDHESPSHAYDPHVWFDPNNVVIWVQRIEQTLTRLDPANANVYAARARAYRTQLGELDVWIWEQIDQVSDADRMMVSDHATLNYFASHYGFETIGAVIPGFSTLSEPSAQDLAGLQDAIRSVGAKAVFVGNTVNPSMARRVAEDTGIQLVLLYTGSLSGPDGPAGSYLEFMRYNVTQIANALK